MNSFLTAALLLFTLSTAPLASAAKDPEVSSLGSAESAQSVMASKSIFEIPEDVLKLRDPFKRPKIVIESTIVKSELETVPLDKFKLVGVVTGPHQLRAMVATDQGKTFFVSEKMKIGLNQGVITKITPDEIQVTERTTNVLGQEEVTESLIKMNADKEADKGSGSKKRASN